MGRNKYPEVTVEKILDVCQRLFLEKGYDNTTIQDIVDELGGLTKGAVYHHFKSKEEIMDAIGDRMFFQNNPFEKVKKRKDLNGIQKIKEVIMLHQADEQSVELTKQAVPLLKNPHILARMIETNRRILCPYWQELIEEGQRDGSVTTKNAKEMAELLVLMDIWMIPSVFPADEREMKRRYIFISQMFEKMGLPIYDGEIGEMIQKLPYFKKENQ